MPYTGVNGPKRPSSLRAASIVPAAAAPAAIPSAFAPGGLSATPASDVSYSDWSAGCWAGNSPARTWYAAVAAAASFEADRRAGGWGRYARWPRSIAFTAS